MKRLARALALALALPAASLASAQEQKLMPLDDGAKDRTWPLFRNRLLNALEKHDRRFVLSILDRNVRTGSSGERGIGEFRKAWALDSDASPLWRELASALFLGSAYVKREQGPQELCAPYLLATWPEEVEPFGHGAIVVKEAAAKAQPSANAATVQTFSYDIVQVLDWDVADQDAASPQHWVKVQGGAGEGYVPEEHVRSPIEMAACFVRGPNGWRLVAFAPAGGE